MAKDEEKDINPDTAHLSASSPDDFGFFNPASIGSFGKAQQLERELSLQKEENRLLRAKYGLDTYEDSREGLFEEQLELEVEKIKTLSADGEFDGYYRDEILKRWGKEPKHPQSESTNAFTRKQRRRLENEQHIIDRVDSEEDD